MSASQRLLPVLVVAGLALGRPSNSAGQAEPAPQAPRLAPGRDLDLRTTEAKDVPVEIVKALAEYVPQDLLVTFQESMPETMITADTAAEGDSGSIERRAAKYATIKRVALDRVTSPGDVQTLRNYSHLPMAFIRVQSLAALDRILAQPEVKGVFENRRNHAIGGPNLSLIGQPIVASAGHKGRGISVAVLDGPVDYANPLFGCTSPGVPASCGVVRAERFGSGGSVESRQHGTNVAGIVHEVAPEAKIVALDVFSGDTAYDADLADAVSWCIANKSVYNIQVLNASLGVHGSRYGAPCSSGPAETGAAELRAAGILPVGAAGNDGFTDGISSPACAPSGVSVGAVYSHSFGSYTFPEPACTDPSTQADRVACFSDSSSFLTMLAPGAPVNSAGFTFSGTSQAAPHVAGAIAVLRAAYPSDRLDQTMSRLLLSGRQVTDGRNGIVKPRLDLATAVLGPYPQCQTRTVTLPFSTAGSLQSNDCHARNSKGHIFYVDGYEFSGTAGQQITVDVSSSGFDTFIQLEAPGGAVVGEAGATPGVTKNSHLTLTLGVAGTFTIWAESYWGGVTGSYSLSARVGGSGNPGRPCGPTVGTLCLSQKRFEVSATYRNQGGSGTAKAISLSDSSGFFTFDNPDSVELVVKVLNACSFTPNIWVFAGGLTNQEVTLTVTDTKTGAVRTYFNPLGTTFVTVTDTAAFSTCSVR